MDGILEHVVYEVWTWSDKIVKSLQNFQIFTLLFVEDVEPILILIKFHLINSLLKLISLFFDHFLSFLNFFLFVLELLNLFINLFLHHLK